MVIVDLILYLLYPYDDRNSVVRKHDPPPMFWAYSGDRVYHTHVQWIGWPLRSLENLLA